MAHIGHTDPLNHVRLSCMARYASRKHAGGEVNVMKYHEPSMGFSSENSFSAVLSEPETDSIS